jgi:hypothetical protein
MHKNEANDPIEQDSEELHRFNLSRGRVLARLWEIADLAPEQTRNGMSAQVKALSMIIAIEGLIPDRRSVAAQSKPAPAPENPPFYVSEWMRNQQNQSVDTQPPLPAQEGAALQPQSVPAGTNDPSPIEVSSRLEQSVVGPAVPGPLNPSQTTLPRVPMADYVAPDTRRPFSIDKNRFGRRR